MCHVVNYIRTTLLTSGDICAIITVDYQIKRSQYLTRGLYMPDIKAFKQAQEESKPEPKTQTDRKFKTEEIDYNRYVGIQQNQDLVVRLLGEPYGFRKSPTDDKMVMYSKIVRDDKKSYLSVYWPVDKEKNDDKFVPDKDFILTRLYDKVREEKWTEWTEEDIKRFPDLNLKKNEKGKVEGVAKNGKTYTGRYVRLHENTAAYKRITANRPEDSREQYPNYFYPKTLVMCNVIDRSDDWCAKNKSAKILGSRQNTDQKTGKVYRDIGIPLKLYDKIVDFIAKGIGDWAKIDIVMYKVGEGKASSYEVFDATTADVNGKKAFLYERFFKSPTTINIASSEPLTEDEKSYKLWDLDKMYNPRYYLIARYLGGLFKLVDLELNTHFYDELRDLVNKEKENNGGEVESDDKEEQPQQREEKVNVINKELVKKVFPNYDALSDEDKKILDLSLREIAVDEEKGVLPVWKEPRKAARCFDEETCRFPNTSVVSNFPETMKQCPVCGKKGN
jgi:hypothetical protein